MATIWYSLNLRNCHFLLSFLSSFQIQTSWTMFNCCFLMEYFLLTKSLCHGNQWIICKCSQMIKRDGRGKVIACLAPASWKSLAAYGALKSSLRMLKQSHNCSISSCVLWFQHLSGADTQKGFRYIACFQTQNRSLHAVNSEFSPLLRSTCFCFKGPYQLETRELRNAWSKERSENLDF